jgi:hypothetical protein
MLSTAKWIIRWHRADTAEESAPPLSDTTNPRERLLRR